MNFMNSSIPGEECESPEHSKLAYSKRNKSECRDNLVRAIGREASVKGGQILPQARTLHRLERKLGITWLFVSFSSVQFSYH